MDLIEESEKEETEKLIYHSFVDESDGALAIFIPQLKNYEGIEILKQKLKESNVPSVNSIDIAFVLWDFTNDSMYLDVIMDNYNNASQDVVKLEIVGRLSNSSPNENIYSILLDIYTYII